MATERPDIRLPLGMGQVGLDHAWHVALNQYEAPHDFDDVARDPAADSKHFMYEAKDAASDVSRLALLFGMERRGELARRHHQCSHDRDGAPVPDNHLTCCLGVECRACPHLAALDRVREGRDYRVQPPMGVEFPDEYRDVMKAWTCVTHILMRGGDTANEGFVLTTDDRMYWDNLYSSLASTPTPEGPAA